MNFEYDMKKQAARDLVDTLQAENDIVRIVEPVSRKVLYWPAVDDGMLDYPCLECNAVWGRGDRCPNCSSLEAVKLRQRTFKVELSDNRAFWVQSRPMNVDGMPCVMETVNDVTEGLLVEGGDRGAVADLIGSLNGLIMTDPLTSLFNRRFLDGFNDRLVELEKAGTCVNVAMLDLDNMKSVNDTYGHPAGDAVLKDVAGFLKLNYSSCGSRNERYAVRYGGDEFLVIDIGTDAVKFADDVRERYARMRRVCYFGDIEFPFSLSCGFSSSDETGWDWDALLECADRRMYADKHTH